MNEQEKIEKICKQYLPKEKTLLSEIKDLDKKAKKGANVFGYLFGIIAALVFGFGMSVALGEILSNFFVIGIICGVVGLIMMLINYPFYKKIRENGMKKYGPQIRKLSSNLK